MSYCLALLTDCLTPLLSFTEQYYILDLSYSPYFNVSYMSNEYK